MQHPSPRTGRHGALAIGIVAAPQLEVSMEADLARTRHAIASLAAAVAATLVIAEPTVAQRSGRILRSYTTSNPPSASILEEATIATAMPFSGVFNNLLIFDQTKPRNGLDTSVPELGMGWITH
jgi:hypothetical protein